MPYIRAATCAGTEVASSVGGGANPDSIGERPVGLHDYASLPAAVNARICRRQGLPGGVTALAPPSGLHAAWGLSSLAVKLIAVTVQGAGGGIPVGKIRMPPVSLVCIPAGLPDGRDVGRMPADPGWSRAGADISPGIIRRPDP